MAKKDTNIVVFINDKIIKAHQVSGDKADLVMESKWETKTLAKLLTKLKSDTKADSIKVIVGDNLAFMSPIFVDTSADDIKGEVLKEAKKILPEELDELGVDWKKIATIGDRFAIQIFAMQKSFLSLLGRASQTAKLNVDSIEPVAYVLARHFQDLDTPQVVVWEDEAVFAAVVHQGQVLASDTITTLDIYSQIEALTLFVQTEYDLNPEKIILASKTNKLDPDKLKSKTKLDIEENTVNLYSDASQKEDLTGPDEDVLNITPKEVFSDDDEEDADSESDDEAESLDESDDEAESPDDADDKANNEEEEEEVSQEAKLAAPSLPIKKSPEPEETPQRQVVEVVEEDSEPDDSPSEDSSKPKSGGKFKFLAIAIFLITLVSGLVLGGVYVYRNAKQGAASPTTEEVEATPTPSPSPTPTPEPEIDKSELSISVLNGSGVPGRAGSVQDTLEDAGYGSVDAGNADSFDFETTEISVKEGQEALIKLLTQDLESDYVIGDTDTNLDEDSDYDAIVTIGTETADTDTSAEEE